MHRAVAALSTAGHAGLRRRQPSGTDSRVPREQSHGQDDGSQTPDENPHLPKDAEAGAKCQTDASPVESRDLTSRAVADAAPRPDGEQGWPAANRAKRERE